MSDATRERDQIQDSLKEIIKKVDKLSKETTINTTKLDKLNGYEERVNNNEQSIKWLTWAVRLIIGSIGVGTAGWTIRGLVGG